MTFLWEQGFVKSLDEFENGFLLMHYGERLVIYHLWRSSDDGGVDTSLSVACQEQRCGSWEWEAEVAVVRSWESAG